MKVSSIASVLLLLITLTACQLSYNSGVKYGDVGEQTECSQYIAGQKTLLSFFSDYEISARYEGSLPTIEIITYYTNAVEDSAFNVPEEGDETFILEKPNGETRTFVPIEVFSDFEEGRQGAKFEVGADLLDWFANGPYPLSVTFSGSRKDVEFDLHRGILQSLRKGFISKCMKSRQ